MIFAEIVTDQHYNDFFQVVDEIIREKFEDVESGLQSDGWIWVKESDDKVVIDTFSSMLFEVKCSNRNSQLLSSVIGLLKEKLELNIFSKPVLEEHEYF
ncbi:hypothetical protein NBRC116583_06890 [Arenicella sp. 4NH20-0111]|uniref:hypothetical protein n=1 Tax=Arenicella sp. 4NH20-0111 TaxID=3127648 RepID=UPI003105C7BA